jgi:uncharacterized protein
MAALKARDDVAVAALKSAVSAIDNAQAVDVPPEAASGGRIAKSRLGVGSAEAPRRRLTRGEVIAVLRREIEEKTAAAGQYERAARVTEAARLRREADVLRPFLG